MLLKLGMNFPQYVTIPKKLLTPLVVVGGWAFLIASTFFGSREIPCPENTNPTNVMLFLFVQGQVSLRELFEYLL